MKGNKKLVCIVGPTASGKSNVAFDLAKHFNTSILSFDSRQCYRELNIGTAKPSQEMLSEIPHYFINSHSIQDSLNASDFEQYALELIEKTNKTTIIVVGGTGLYLQALTEGLSDVSMIDDGVREFWQREFEVKGLAFIVEELKKVDKEYANKIDCKNPRRVLRGLEVYHTTKQKISQQQRQSNRPIKRSFEVDQNWTSS